VKIHSKTIKKLGNILKMENDNGYAVSVLIALILVSILVASYYALMKPPQEGYITIP
jgi:hypothetical protein